MSFGGPNQQIFNHCLLFQTRLYILDCFWVEGVKIFFRFSIALIELTWLNMSTDFNFNQKTIASGDVINMIRDQTRQCYDILALKKIAFQSIKLPKRKQMATRRAFYVKQIILEDNSDSKMANGLIKSVSKFHQHPSQSDRQSEVVVISDDGGCIAIQCPKNWKNGVHTIEIFYPSTSASQSSRIQAPRSCILFGISKDSQHLLFYQKQSKPSSTSSPPNFSDGCPSNGSIAILPVKYDVVSAYYNDDRKIALLIGFNGYISKIDTVTRSTEVMTFSKKVRMSSYDPCTSFLWVYSSTSLVIIETSSMDVYAILKEDPLTHLSCCSFTPLNGLSSSSLTNSVPPCAFIARFNGSGDGGNFSTVSFKSIYQSCDIFKCEEMSVLRMKSFSFGNDQYGIAIIFGSGRLSFFRLFHVSQNATIKQKSCYISGEFTESGHILSCQLHSDNMVTLVLFAPRNKLCRLHF